MCNFLFLVGNPQSFGLTSVPGKEQEFKETVAVAIDYANALQCKKLSLKFVFPTCTCMAWYVITVVLLCTQNPLFGWYLS